MGIKGFISGEFMIVLSLVALVFLILTVIVEGQETNLLMIRDRLATERNAYALSSALNYAYLAGEGTEYNFSFHGMSMDENISFYQNSVESKRDRAQSSAPLLNGDISAGFVGNGYMVIKNNDGGIEIEQ